MNFWPATTNLLVWSSIFNFIVQQLHGLLVTYFYYDNLLFCVIYWLIQDENQGRFKRLVPLDSWFTDPMTEVYLLIFQATIPTFTSFNLVLQREQPSRLLLYDKVGFDFAVFFPLFLCKRMQICMQAMFQVYGSSSSPELRMRIQIAFREGKPLTRLVFDYYYD